MKKIKILFVCKGNICRSPTAHGVFRGLIKNSNLSDLINVESVGTNSREWHEGDSADLRSIETAKRYDCDLSDIISEQLEKRHLDEFDYIIAMDDENINTIINMFPNIDLSKVTKLLKFAPTLAIENVPDPYFENNFEKVFLMIDTACHGLLENIKDKYKI